MRSIRSICTVPIEKTIRVSFYDDGQLQWEGITAYIGERDKELCDRLRLQEDIILSGKDIVSKKLRDYLENYLEYLIIERPHPTKMEKKWEEDYNIRGKKTILSARSIYDSFIRTINDFINLINSAIEDNFDIYISYIDRNDVPLFPQLSWCVPSEAGWEQVSPCSV